MVMDVHTRIALLGAADALFKALNLILDKNLHSSDNPDVKELLKKAESEIRIAYVFLGCDNTGT